MKTKTNFLFIIMILSFVLFSCNKDDGDDKKNAFTYNGTEYALDNATVEYVGLIAEGYDYNFDIFIFSEDIDYNSEFGTGNRIFFELFSETFEEVKGDTYNFTANRTGQSGSFGPGNKSIVTIDYDALTGRGTEIEIVSGELIVSSGGTNFTFEFNLVTADNKTIEGYYSGQTTRLKF